MQLESVEEILQILNEFPVSEIDVTRGGARIHVRSGRPVRPAVVPPTPEEERVAEEAAEVLATETAEAQIVALTATMVGLFHEANPPIRHGAVIVPGQVVGNIESIKVMNDVLAEQGGRVIEVSAEDGSPVEYGQVLFRLAPE